MEVRVSPTSGFAQFVEPQAREQTGQDEHQVAFGPVGSPRRLLVAVNRLEQGTDRGPGQGAGEGLGRLGTPDERHRIGWDEFGGIRKSHNAFQVDQHRRIDAGSRVDA